MTGPLAVRGVDLAPLPGRRTPRPIVLVGTAAALALLLVLVALSRDTAEPPTATDADEVRVIRADRDVPYVVPDGDDPVLLLDVWSPVPLATSAGPTTGHPLVVLYAPRATADRSLSLTAVARSLAATGTVVVVPEPPAPDRNPSASPSSGEVLAGLTGDASCAASFALEHAADWGADPDSLVLVGAAEGALAAASVAFRQVAPSQGCVAAAPLATPRHLVLHEAQWLLGGPFDLSLRADAEAYDGLALWSAVPDAPQQDVTLLMDSTTVRPERLDPDLRPMPSAAEASVRRHEVWADDMVTIQESNAVLLDVLDAGGHEVRLVQYAGDWRRFGPATGEAMAEAVRDATR